MLPSISGTRAEMKTLYNYSVKKVRGEPVSQKETQLALRTAKKIGVTIGAVVGIVVLAIGVGKWRKKEAEKKLRQEEKHTAVETERLKQEREDKLAQQEELANLAEELAKNK